MQLFSVDFFSSGLVGLKPVLLDCLFPGQCRKEEGEPILGGNSLFKYETKSGHTDYDLSLYTYLCLCFTKFVNVGGGG